MLLAALVFICGQPLADAPGMPGNEQASITDNPLLAATDASPGGRLAHCLAALGASGRAPIPLLTYGLQAGLGCGGLAWVRYTDVCLHVLNALLVWAMLYVLLRPPSEPTRRGTGRMMIAYALALLWAMHPALVPIYTADANRAPLLATLLALLSLLACMSAAAGGRQRHVVLALLVLALATLCAPLMLWVVPVALIDWRARGMRRVLRSAHIYLVAIVCMAGALVLLDDLWGNLRSNVPWEATWLAVRCALMPLRVAPAYPITAPVPLWQIGTTLAALGVSVMIAVLTLRHSATRLIGIGITWFWLLLLPVLWIDTPDDTLLTNRDSYLPLIGLFIAVAGLADLWLTHGPRRRWIIPGMVALALALGLVPGNRGLCEASRTAVNRANRLVEVRPHDAAAWEMLTLAYQRAAVSDTFESRRLDTKTLLERACNAQDRTVDIVAANPDAFGDSGARAAFYRRAAFRYGLYGRPQRALACAEQAVAIDQDNPASWTSLAHARRGVGQWSEALIAYEWLERNTAPDAAYRGARLAEHGNLLLRQLGRAADAIPRLREARDDPRITGAARRTLLIDLALAEIRGGSGGEGERIIHEVLARGDGGVEAAFVLGEYHLRSHKWPEAEQVYAAIIVTDPVNYRALRGLHEALAHQGRYDEATRVWADAYRASGEDRVFWSFLVWSAACAGDSGAAYSVTTLLAEEPDNPLACYAQGLLLLRDGKLREAFVTARKARDGRPIPQEDAARRAAGTLERLTDQGQLPAEALVLSAAIWLDAGVPARAERLLARYLATPGDAEGEALVAELRRELDAQSTPAP